MFQTSTEKIEKPSQFHGLLNKTFSRIVGIWFVLSTLHFHSSDGLIHDS